MVIRAFSCNSPPLRAVDVAVKMGISRAAARRFLLTLQDLGYVGSEGEPFYVRPALLDLRFSYLDSLGVEDIVQRALNCIAELTEASSSFAVLDCDEVVFVARAPSKSIFQVATRIDWRVAAHATSLREVLLAGLSAAELDRYMASSNRVAFTKKTTTEASALSAGFNKFAPKDIP